MSNSSPNRRAATHCGICTKSTRDQKVIECESCLGRFHTTCADVGHDEKPLKWYCPAAACQQRAHEIQQQLKNLKPSVDFRKDVSNKNQQWLKLDEKRKLESEVQRMRNREEKERQALRQQNVQLDLQGDEQDKEATVKGANLIILACKQNKVKVLEYLLSGSSDILGNSFVSSEETTILPEDEDEYCHNAFYYAIRSGNLELLETLIDKWPGNYFADHGDELDEILSQAYENLKLIAVPLSEEMEFYVENKLLSFRFFSNTSGPKQNAKDSFYTKERIETILQSIDQLMVQYSTKEEVDEKFLFIAKYIAQNIHILKRQLKSTYTTIPWEEIEFCLVCFVSSHMKRQELNLFYNAILNKNRILDHLKLFSMKLRDIKNVDDVEFISLIDFLKLKREKIVAEIIGNNPQFEELYNDFQKLRDMYSLEKMNDYIKLGLSIDPKQREGQLIITRVLQVIGEHLKNTPASPKLSNTTSELLLMSLPRNTREILIDLRNSLSHAYSVTKRTEIEDNSDANFFTGVQNDTRRIHDVITGILYNNKIKVIRTLLTKISTSESVDEIKQLGAIFNTIDMDTIFTAKFEIIEHDKLNNLIQELTNSITDKTDYENALIGKINSIMSSTKTSSNIRTDYLSAIASLKSIGLGLKDNVVNEMVIRGLKFFINQTLKFIPPQVESYNLKEIAELSIRVLHSAKSRNQDDNGDKLDRLVCEIFYIAEFGTGDLNWIADLRSKLNLKSAFIPLRKQKYNIAEENYHEQLEPKLSELECILKNNILSNKFIEELSFYKKNRKLQVVVEMLVLDITSILGESERYLENNWMYLDDNTPLLTGKCLRNHLAHDNTLVDVLLCDPMIAVSLNARKLISENVIKSNKKMGMLINVHPVRQKSRYDQRLSTLTYQQQMFAALEEGNLDDLKSCLRKGADLFAKTNNSTTALHCAARGPNLDVFKFIINQNIPVDVRDANNQTALHIAAAHGRKNVVDLLLKQQGLSVHDVDNTGRTPLHIAAKTGNKEAVEILLKNNANLNSKDKTGFTALHLAIKNNHIDIVESLLKTETNVDIIETMGGFTSLHIAAESGHAEVVKYLLKIGANVNAMSDKQANPLHIAALNGHSEVVTALILGGTDVNSRALDGCTPLHYAVENNHIKVVNTLLQHGARTNITDKTYHTTPLHVAVLEGHEEIVEALLKHKADANIRTHEGSTLLHLAAQNGSSKIMAVLLEAGIDIRTRDNFNGTPLHYAANKGHTAVAEVLIKHGADINAGDDTDMTPLHAAAMENHTNFIELLIRKNANVGCKDREGRVPIHITAMKGNNDAIALLIENKADVNARTKDGMTALYVAAQFGHAETVSFLIKQGAEVNTKINYGYTALHTATQGGYKEVVNVLIKNGANVCDEDTSITSTLCAAVETGDSEIVEMLIANGANVNAKSKSLTPLLTAIKHNHKDIVELLLKNGANPAPRGGEPLSLAVIAGYKDIVDMLLEHKAPVDSTDPEGATPLHWAANRGHKEIVNSLIMKGAYVDAVSTNGSTPLYLAAEKGCDEVVEILIENGADVNLYVQDTALHIAAARGHASIVEILLNKGAKMDEEDSMNRTPLEMAVGRGQLQVVRMFLQFKKKDMNAKGDEGWTVLHIASQINNLEMVKCLVDEGCDIDARNASGSKPIHIAAREGNIDILKFYLSKGLGIDEPGTFNQTLLHYAASKGQLEVVKYLLDSNATVNARDINGEIPLHLAATYGNKEIVQILLEKGSILNATDKFNRNPLAMAQNKDVIRLLASTEKLFSSIARNNLSDVENDIRAGACTNARNADNETPLHVAVSCGHEKVVRILLENKTLPNALDSKGFTAMHTAAKLSHLKIVKTLLTYGATYNAISGNGKTPSDLAANRDITSLFKIIDESFKKVKLNNERVVNDLNKIQDIDTVRAVLGACNRENRTLIVAAIHCKFSKIDQLKQIKQGDISALISATNILLVQGSYQHALQVANKALETRKEILGPDNPGTLDIQTLIGKGLYKQGSFLEALDILEKTFEKQKEMLGLNAKDTLDTRSTIALILHRLGKDEEAFDIYQEVFQKQVEILGPNHSDTTTTQFHMGVVLNSQEKFDDALNCFRAVYRRKKDNANDPITVSCQNNIAMILSNQGKHEEALKIYEKVLEKKKTIFGDDHADTLRTLTCIGAILYKQEKYSEALQIFQQAFNSQKRSLKHNHPETLNTQYNIANLLLSQGKYISALKNFKECFEQRKALFGPFHPTVLDTASKLEAINVLLQREGSEVSEILQHLQKDISIAAGKGDAQTVKRLLEQGADANDQDIEGRTPLHYAVNNQHIDVAELLLQNGAHATSVTNKGNTPLHTAASKCHKEMVDVLLKHVSGDNLPDFVNAKTSSGGTTALHVAAKSGSLEIVKCLLRHGATYSAENKESKTPAELSKNQIVANLFKLIDELFKDVKNGNEGAITKLRALERDDFLTITKARSNQEHTLLQVAIFNKQKKIAGELVKMLKETDQN